MHRDVAAEKSSRLVPPAVLREKYSGGYEPAEANDWALHWWSRCSGEVAEEQQAHSAYAKATARQERLLYPGKMGLGLHSTAGALVLHSLGDGGTSPPRRTTGRRTGRGDATRECHVTVLSSSFCVAGKRFEQKEAKAAKEAPISGGSVGAAGGRIWNSGSGHGCVNRRVRCVHRL
jgi:hypothetical protein